MGRPKKLKIGDAGVEAPAMIDEQVIEIPDEEKVIEVYDANIFEQFSIKDLTDHIALIDDQIANIQRAEGVETNLEIEALKEEQAQEIEKAKQAVEENNLNCNVQDIVEAKLQEREIAKEDQEAINE